MPYLWVAVGSALGGIMRYALTRLTLAISADFPFGTIFINIAGSFVIGYFGALTLQSGRYAVSDNLRLFVMVGICGGFTTFSSFSMQTFDLLRTGAWGRAMANIVVSVVLCLAAVAAGHLLGEHQVARLAITASAPEDHLG
ncbi:MAG TPA: fluoride efflux transporter CrcB [Acidobacteriaceae bacterium]